MNMNIQRKSTKKGDRWFFLKNDKIISPFHNLENDFYEENGKLFVNMIVEIPKNTKRKMEISIDEKNNPIKQDTKKNKLRFVAERKNRPTRKQNSKYYTIMNKIWKDKEGYNLFSYGAIPKTYENPKISIEEYKKNDFYDDLLKVKIDNETTLDDNDNKVNLKNYLINKNLIINNKLNPKNIYGDGDPLDIFLVHANNIKFKIGSFIKVEILGIIPMIDDGELDWKVLAKLPDDNKIYNNKIKTYINWFKYYKGKYDNKSKLFNRQNIIFGNNGNIMNKNIAKIVIDNCIEQYTQSFL